MQKPEIVNGSQRHALKSVLCSITKDDVEHDVPCCVTKVILHL